MCRVTLVTCLFCKEPKTRDIISFSKAKRLYNLNSKRSIIAKELLCGYWFCKFMQDRHHEKYRSRIDQTCGDQMCNIDQCLLRNFKIDCCHARIKVYRFCVSPARAQPLYPSCFTDYLTPRLELFQLAERLYARLTCSDRELLGLGKIVSIGDQDYEITIVANVKEDVLNVCVIRKDGEYTPKKLSLPLRAFLPWFVKRL